MKKLLETIKAEEDAAWKMLRIYSDRFGDDDKSTNLRRTRWVELKRFRRMIEKRMEELGEI